MNRGSLGWILGISAIFTLGFVGIPSKPVAFQMDGSLDTLISKNFVMGKFMANTHVRFSAVPPMICSKPMYLQKEVIESFQRMRRSAMTASIDLKIISGTRNKVSLIASIVTSTYRRQSLFMFLLLFSTCFAQLRNSQRGRQRCRQKNLRVPQNGETVRCVEEIQSLLQRL